MGAFLIGIGRVICIIFILLLGVLVWKTAEYFNSLPKYDKNSPLLAWDTLVLFLMMIYLLIKAVLM